MQASRSPSLDAAFPAAVRRALAGKLRAACGGLLLVCVAAAVAAPSADLWPRWQQHDPASTRSVDHAAWNTLLSRLVRPQPDGSTRFAYAEVTAADRALLEAYLRMLADTPVSTLARDEQYAYWVNLYNALTVRVVLDHYPLGSIRDIDISPGLFAIGPWDAPLFAVEGQTLTLNDIEHRILRPIWADPRTHYVVNCASIGCPDLRAEAVTAGNRERLLEAAARAHVNHPRGARVDDDGEIIVSSIYKWFAEDFGGTARAVLAHIARFAEEPLATRAREAHRIAAYEYDWTLNDAGR